MSHNAKFLMPQQECMVIIVPDPSHLKKKGLICGYYCETNTAIVKAHIQQATQNGGDNKEQSLV